MSNRNRIVRAFLCATLCLVLIFCSGCSFTAWEEPTSTTPSAFKEIPTYQGEAFAVVGNNVPSFGPKDLTAVSYESYAPLDSLGRCGTAVACIGPDLMPTEERGAIGSVKPTGWRNQKYSFVDGNYLYNRCHLIGFQLTGENANVQNLITGTRYLNTQGMLPFENMVADYIRETGNHVLYRVIPIFEGSDLVARGVTMEAYSVEDSGEGICFFVFCFNIQPGVIIDYDTGDNRLDPATAPTEFSEDIIGTYVLNTSSKKIHMPSCSAVEDMAAHNRKSYRGSPSSLLAEGYSICNACFS